MKAPIGMILRPFVHLGRLVRGHVFQDHTNLGPGVEAGSGVIEKGQEFLREMRLATSRAAMIQVVPLRAWS